MDIHRKKWTLNTISNLSSTNWTMGYEGRCYGTDTAFTCMCTTREKPRLVVSLITTRKNTKDIQHWFQCIPADQWETLSPQQEVRQDGGTFSHGIQPGTPDWCLFAAASRPFSAVGLAKVVHQVTKKVVESSHIGALHCTVLYKKKSLKESRLKRVGIF